MSVKPILFNTPMVQAILAGQKTQTRRVCKVSSRTRNIENKDCGSVVYPSSNFCGICADFYDKKGFWRGAGKPKYQPGDILYVRETFGYGYYAAWDGRTYYKADYPEGMPKFVCKWHPSIHMPKEAARIFLRVTNVWVERLQDMSDRDALAEGVCVRSTTLYDGIYCNAFRDLWDGTIKPADRDRYGWDANPWVWVIEFERIEKEDAQ